MTPQTQTTSQPELIYPENDGQLMADNTKQFRWIVASAIALWILKSINKKQRNKQWVE